MINQVCVPQPGCDGRNQANVSINYNVFKFLNKLIYVDLLIVY